MSEGKIEFFGGGISLVRERLMEMRGKLQPQGASEKIKKHLDWVIENLGEIHKEGYEVIVDESNSMSEIGVTGYIHLKLSPIEHPEIEVSFIEELFDNSKLDKFIDKYPDKDAYEESYEKAKKEITDILENKSHRETPAQRKTTEPTDKHTELKKAA
jgi:hypothetical protein